MGSGQLGEIAIYRRNVSDPKMWDMTQSYIYWNRIIAITGNDCKVLFEVYPNINCKSSTRT